MTTVLSLSNELLDRIIQAIPREDLLALALTNRIFNALTERALKRHLALRTKYSTLTFGRFENDDFIPVSSRHDDVYHAVLVLESIIRDPEIIYYPKTMRIGSCDDPEDPYNDGGDEQDDEDDWPDSTLTAEALTKRRSAIANCSDQLKVMIEDCEFIESKMKSRAFNEIRRPKNEGVAIALLATMLPNLSSIVTQDWSHNAASFWLQECAQHAAVSILQPQPQTHVPTQVMARLQEFSMHHTDTENGEDMNSYGAFAMLPSMRKLHGEYIDGGDFVWFRPLLAGSSNVTEIDFTYSAVSAADFESLLSHISALQKFIYHHVGATVAFAAYNLAEYLTALRKYAASSLQILDITGDDNEDWREEDEEYQPTRSLKMFSLLERVRLEDKAFERPEYVSLSDSSSNMKKFNESLINPESSMEQLVDILPASVKSLTLIPTKRDRDMRDLFRGMSERKAEDLPNLERVIFVGKDPLDDRLKSSLKNAGIELKSWDITL